MTIMKNSIRIKMNQGEEWIRKMHIADAKSGIFVATFLWEILQ